MLPVGQVSRWAGSPGSAGSGQTMVGSSWSGDSSLLSSSCRFWWVNRVCRRSRSRPDVGDSFTARTSSPARSPDETRGTIINKLQTFLICKEIKSDFSVVFFFSFKLTAPPAGQTHKLAGVPDVSPSLADGPNGSTSLTKT